MVEKANFFPGDYKKLSFRWKRNPFVLNLITSHPRIYELFLWINQESSENMRNIFLTEIYKNFFQVNFFSF